MNIYAHYGRRRLYSLYKYVITNKDGDRFSIVASCWEEAVKHACRQWCVRNIELTDEVIYVPDMGILT
jgi:hypothetical protein